MGNIEQYLSEIIASRILNYFHCLITLRMFSYLFKLLENSYHKSVPHDPHCYSHHSVTNFSYQGAVPRRSILQLTNLRSAIFVTKYNHLEYVESLEGCW